MWIYLASEKQTDLPSTLEAVLRHQLLWRPATNDRGALIANVPNLQVGDWMVLAWRGDRCAYLKCRIARPHDPVVSRGRATVVDQIASQDADGLAQSGYRPGADGVFEAIRFDLVEECYAALRGRYGGNNSIHRLDVLDATSVTVGGVIPPEAWRKRGNEKALGLQGRRARKSSSDATPAPRLSPSPEPEPRSSVDAINIGRSAIRRAFDAYVMVDWSSSSRPTTGNDSIWIASGCWSSNGFRADAPVNISTRIEASSRVASLARQWMSEGARVLVGMDFAFGYPAGFAKALGLSCNNGSWRAVHEHIAGFVTDTARNEHNRDSFADACNRAIGPTGPGPFWGCTAGAVTENLTQQRQGLFKYPYAGTLQEWRVTDRRARETAVTQPVWKLNCGVSVGGQTIVGIKHLHELAEAVGGKRWPFETGWEVPPEDQPCTWFVEIFPSLIQYPEWADEYRIRRDRTQVQSCVRRAAEDDRDGVLTSRFREPRDLNEQELARVAGEEGWILFV